MKNTRKLALFAIILCLSAFLFACGEKKTEIFPEISTPEVSENDDNVLADEKIEETEKEGSSEETENEITEETKQEGATVDIPALPEEEPKPDVYEYKNVTMEIVPDDETLASWGDIFTSSFRVPAVNLESDNAKAFNQKIFDEYPSYAFAEVSDTPVSVDRIYRYDYFSDVTDNAMVAIVLQKQVGYFYSEYGTEFKAYYYDLKGDCELSAEDYLDSLDIDLDDFFANVKKELYIRAAHGELSFSYDLKYVDEYSKVGKVVIASENEGFLLTEIEGEYGSYLDEFSVLSQDSEKVTCSADAHVYATPSPEAEIIDILEPGAEVLILTKALLPEGLETIEFDTKFSWYAVEFGGTYGYMLEHELNFRG